MSTLRYELINATNNRTLTLIDNNIHDNIHKRYEFRKQTVLADESLTTGEKSVAINICTKYYDKEKVLLNEGTRRICEICNEKCLATLYCENCVQDYLKKKFSKWTSGNKIIDNLIQECQLETLTPNKIIEWIPDDKLKSTKTKSKYCKIGKANWIDGHFHEWSYKDQKLLRTGIEKVILKDLENIENTCQSWFNKVCNFVSILPFF